MTIVQRSIVEIRASNPQLADIPLNIRKFSHRDAALWFSSCYVFLSRELNPSPLTSTDAKPRVDLLEIWGKALIKKHPDWEVA